MVESLSSYCQIWPSKEEANLTNLTNLHNLIHMQVQNNITVEGIRGERFL